MTKNSISKLSSFTQPLLDTRNSLVSIGLFTFLLGLFTRLMFLDSNVFFFDGDEAILGVMALDLLNGDPAFYFYGQAYGFSFIEVLMISLGIKAFGINMLAIKIPMLVLWLSTIMLIGLTIRKITQHNLLLILLSIAVIVLSPTWLVWSMKARGGYLTSFFCSSLIVYAIVHFKCRLKLLQWFFCGGILTIMWEAQPLFVLPTIPIVLYGVYKSCNSKLINFLKSSASILTGVGIVSAILFYIKHGVEQVWNTPKPSILSRLSKISELPDVLINNLGGNYFLSSTYTENNEVYSKVFLFGFILFSIIILYNSFKFRKVDLKLVFLISSFLSLFGFLVKSEPRYLLPFFSFALLAVVSAGVYPKNNLFLVKNIFLVLMILLGINSLPVFKEFSFVNMKINKVDKVSNDLKIMENLITLLKKENIKYVYSTNEFLQYQLNYLTNNEIITIGRTDRCRTPWNVEKIQNAYNDNKGKFAVIGYNFRYAYSGKIPVLGDKIFYVLRPSQQVLSQVGFFNNPKQKNATQKK